MNQDQKQENSPEIANEEVEVKESDDQTQPSVSAEPPDTISEQDAPSDSDSAALVSASETNVSETPKVEIASTPETSEGSVAAESAEEIDSKRSEANDVSSDSPTEDNMAEMDMEALLSATDNSFETVSEGRIIPGTIVSINADEVLVDIGFKSEGIIPTREFDTDAEGNLRITLGDEIEVYVVRKENLDGQVELSKSQAKIHRAWDNIAKAYNEQSVVTGTVTDRVKGGMSVEVDGLRGFLPASQIELRAVPNLDDYIDQSLEMRVVKFNRRRDNIVLSRRVLLEDELNRKRSALLEQIEKGNPVTGVVKSIAPFGVFIDLDGIDGLLHRSDMSWGKVNHPSEMLAIGDEVEALVIDVDRENERISLGLKQKTSDPGHLFQRNIR